jgi:rRNA-processing protein FCF1
MPWQRKETMQIVPFIVRLEQQLKSLENKVIELLNASTIEKYPDHSYDPFYEPEIIAIANNNYWGDDDGSQKHLQLKLLRSYSSWFERFQMLFHNSPEEIQRQIGETHKNVKEWIEKKDGWNVPRTIDEAKQSFREELQEFYTLLQIFQPSDKTEIILVPDTNALITCPDVASYAAAIGRADYTVVILPTVLSELDKLKIIHRSDDFRKKVQSVITRLKGLRQQGSMHEGVIVNKVVTVKMVAQEPDFKRTLSWLDPTNNDDRIIAATLEVQVEEPSNIVVLVTADINHQNKAEMANIPFVEPPEA